MTNSPHETDVTALLPFVAPGEFHPLLNNKFEAAFTTGRAINYINFRHNLGEAICDPFCYKNLEPIATLLLRSCHALELELEQRILVQDAISTLVASLTPTENTLANSEYGAESLQNWLRNVGEVEPLATPSSILQFATDTPLHNLLNTITSGQSVISKWIFFGLEIDRVFRPLSLARRIRKQQNADNEYESVIMDDAKFLGVEHRNYCINEVFSRYSSPHTFLIAPTSTENDQQCESIIATQVRALSERNAVEEGILGFKKIWLVELNDSAIRRNSIMIDLNPDEFRLVKRLVEDRAKSALENNEPFLSNAKVAEIYNNAKEGARTSYRCEIDRINDKLEPLRLHLKSSRRGREFGRYIVDMVENIRDK